MHQASKLATRGKFRQRHLDRLPPLQAIILAGWYPRVELLGISTVAGNQTVEKTTRNALDVLSAAGLHGIGTAPSPDCSDG